MSTSQSVDQRQSVQGWEGQATMETAGARNDL